MFWPSRNILKSQDKKINEILTEWNPIDVPGDIAKTEYISFIPVIKKQINSEIEIIACLEDILINKLELDYNRFNPLQRQELKEVAEKIINI